MGSEHDAGLGGSETALPSAEKERYSIFSSTSSFVKAIDKKARGCLSSINFSSVDSEDSSAMTINFLRARLQAQRAEYKAEKHRAQKLAERVLELEQRLSAGVNIVYGDHSTVENGIRGGHMKGVQEEHVDLKEIVHDITRKDMRQAELKCSGKDGSQCLDNCTNVLTGAGNYHRIESNKFFSHMEGVSKGLCEGTSCHLKQRICLDAQASNVASVKEARVCAGRACTRPLNFKNTTPTSLGIAQEAQSELQFDVSIPWASEESKCEPNLNMKSKPCFLGVQPSLPCMQGWSQLQACTVCKQDRMGGHSTCILEESGKQGISQARSCNRQYVDNDYGYNMSPRSSLYFGSTMDSQGGYKDVADVGGMQLDYTQRKHCSKVPPHSESAYYPSTNSRACVPYEPLSKCHLSRNGKVLASKWSEQQQYPQNNIGTCVHVPDYGKDRSVYAKEAKAPLVACDHYTGPRARIGKMQPSVGANPSWFEVGQASLDARLGSVQQILGALEIAKRQVLTSADFV